MKMSANPATPTGPQFSRSGPRAASARDTRAHAAPADEPAMIAALRRGEESAFRQLVERYHAPLLRLAKFYVPSRAVAEVVVQETWLGVLRGLETFEGRSSLKTWIFRILTNRAKTRGERESRSIPFSAMANLNDGAGPAVEAERFHPADHPEWPGHWSQPPQSWGDSPEKMLLAAETRSFIQRAIEALPAEKCARFDYHLSLCGSCREYIKKMRLTVKALGRLTEDSIPERVMQQLMQVFCNWKES